jgi:hypothetical protein
LAELGKPSRLRLGRTFNLSDEPRRYRLREGFSGSPAGPSEGAGIADGLLSLRPRAAGVAVIDLMKSQGADRTKQ